MTAASQRSPTGTIGALVRYPLSFGAAFAVTVTIFFGMQLLIVEVEGELKERRPSPPIEMVRVKRTVAPVEKKRELPTKPKAAAEPPPPSMEMSDPSAPSNAMAVPIAAPTPQTSVALKGGAGITSATVGDAAATPLVRVNPQLPHRARLEGVEGMVVVRFDIGPTGKVMNVKIVEVHPQGYGFEKAALRAVKRWKYRPKVVDGAVVIQKGVETAFRFTVE